MTTTLIRMLSAFIFPDGPVNGGEILGVNSTLAATLVSDGVAVLYDGGSGRAPDGFAISRHRRMGDPGPIRRGRRDTWRPGRICRRPGPDRQDYHHRWPCAAQQRAVGVTNSSRRLRLAAGSSSRETQMRAFRPAGPQRSDARMHDRHSSRERVRRVCARQDEPKYVGIT